MALEDEIKRLDGIILKMAGQVESNLFYAMDAYLNFDISKKYTPVNDAKVNAYEREAEEIALSILLRERLFARDMRMVTGIMTMVEDLERLGDHAQDVMEFALKLRNTEGYHNESIKELTEFVLKMVTDAIKSYIDRNIDLAKEVIKRDDYVDNRYSELIDYLILEDGKKTISSAFAIYTTLIVKYIERIADHATNIAEWVIYIVTGYYKDTQIV